MMTLVLLLSRPHNGVNYVWPMSIIMRALTSTNDTEITQCLHTLKQAAAGTGELAHKNCLPSKEERALRNDFPLVLRLVAFNTRKPAPCCVVQRSKQNHGK